MRKYVGPTVARSEMPTCRNCGRACLPDYETESTLNYEEDGYNYVVRRTGKVRGYGYESLFCTQECAKRFGLRCVRAGVTFEKYDARRRAELGLKESEARKEK